MRTAQEILDDHNKTLASMGGSGVFQPFIDLCMKTYEVSTLDYLTQQLMLICITSAVNSSPEIILSHVKMYFDGGGNREDLVSAMNLCVIACGGPGLAWGGVAVDAFDQLVAEAK